jgi:hypothetical protein
MEFPVNGCRSSSKDDFRSLPDNVASGLLRQGDEFESAVIDYHLTRIRKGVP